MCQVQALIYATGNLVYKIGASSRDKIEDQAGVD